MRSKVGIGIIGTGFARKVQIPSFRACENAEVVSVASGNIENAASAAREFDIPHFTADWRETVSHPDVDLVCIATPPDLHLEMTLLSLEQGKHLLCEKPMAMNVAEAAEMVEKAKGSALLALIDHELRFQPGRQKALEMLRAGEIGKIRHAKYNFRAPHRGDPNLPWNWWSDETQGGGALGAIASHVIDSFHWFLGTAISSVFCQLQTHIKQRPDGRAGGMREVTSDDESNMLLRFADSDVTDDCTGLVSVSMTEAPQYQNRIEFFGTEGAMRVDHRGELFVAKHGETDWREIGVDLGSAIESVPDTGFSRGFMAFAPLIVDAIREGRNHIDQAATFEDGLKVQRVLDAARKSNDSQCIVRV
jgi:predicted dehydrogenase